MQKIKSYSKSCLACNIAGLMHNSNCNPEVQSLNIAYSLYAIIFIPTCIILPLFARAKTPFALLIEKQILKQKLYLP